MIKQKDIMTAVNRLLIAPEAYPDYTVYIQGCPKDFTRPSFLLEYIRTSISDANYSTVEKTVYCTITAFVQTDDRYQSDMDELADLQDGVMALFLPGYITVRDRAIKVQVSNGGMDTDRAYIDIQFNFNDDRSDAEDNTPLIQTVSTTLEEG